MFIRISVIVSIFSLFLLFCTYTVADSLLSKHSVNPQTCDKNGCPKVKGKTSSENEINPVVEATPTEIDVMLTFVNAKDNHNLQNQFRKTTYSILQHASVPLEFFIIGEPASQKLAKEIIEENNNNFHRPIKVIKIYFNFCKRKKIMKFL